MSKPSSNQAQAFIRRSSGTGVFRESGCGQEAYRPLVAAWIIETALIFRLYKKVSRNRLPDIFEDGSPFMKLTGFAFPRGDVIPEEDGSFSSDAGKTKLSNSQIAALLLEKRKYWDARNVSQNLPLLKNIETLGRHLGLSTVEMSTLFFAVFNEANTPFEEFLSDWSPRFNGRAFLIFIGRLTGFSEGEVTSAFHSEGNLARIGLLTLDNPQQLLGHKMDVMSGLETILSLRYRTDAQLLAKFMSDAGQGELSLPDFEHLSQDIDVLQQYLVNAVARKEKGVNVLLYGDPGTGKTELAKALAKALGIPLFEVSYKGEGGEVLSGKDRLKAFSFCQRVLEKSPASLVMFDEIEDVFSSGNSLLAMFGLAPTERTGKAWINRIMETNPVPSIWITNNPEIDPAYLRRFDYSIRFPKPPKHVRLRMARRHLGALASNETWLEKLASHEDVSPAQFSTAAKVARLGGKSAENRRALAERTLDRSMRLLGQTRQPVNNRLNTGYDLSLINADRDLNQLSQGLKRLRSGSLCFYGPPGTGKSELARFLADEIGKPLILKRASDLMSKWVGETEQLIAGMFDEARESEAVLLLDEADSFLNDRRGAKAQWEVTQVNELLTQMEAFDGVFICTTNLMENLDQASLRRFAFKIKLDYLRPEQRSAMFEQEFVRIGGDATAAELLVADVRRLERLTPGDFAVVMRQLKFQEDKPSAAVFYDLLARECRAKGSKSSIGFVSGIN